MGRVARRTTHGRGWQFFCFFFSGTTLPLHFTSAPCGREPPTSAGFASGDVFGVGFQWPQAANCTVTGRRRSLARRGFLSKPFRPLQPSLAAFWDILGPPKSSSRIHVLFTHSNIRRASEDAQRDETGWRVANIGEERRSHGGSLDVPLANRFIGLSVCGSRT